MFVKKAITFWILVCFVFQQINVFAGTNNGTIGVYGSTDGNAGSVVRPSNDETYTNNGTIQGWRGLINIRSRSGTTTTNSEGAVIKFSGTGGWMPGGTNSETNTSTLNVLPGDRSFTMELNLFSADNKVSPVIDTQRMSAILTSNRIDNVITDVTEDNRVDTLLDDPSAATYISKENTLETSATSLRIIVDAHVSESNDIKAFYAISESEGFEPIFRPFPGHDNLDENGRVKTSDKSSGKSDSLITKSDESGFIPEELEYKEYTFTANELPSFKSFRIKFLMTSTNQAFVPRLTSLKVIATA